ncbi:MAG: glycosyltransferase family 4 protein [Pseudomonadales bacterium]|nr:glycosyltransferase family 4 protein [Pseudomonadales bacterium]
MGNPIDIERISSSQVGLGDKSSIAYVGRLDALKGVLTLLQAFHSLKRKHPNLTLLIVGDGPVRTSVEETISKLDLGDSVSLTGQMPRDKALQLMVNQRIIVLPTLFETFGLTVAEAACLGVPCVSSRYCVDLGQIKFEPYSATALADRLLQVIEDQQLAASTAARQWELVKALDEKLVLETLAQHIDRTVNQTSEFSRVR